MSASNLKKTIRSLLRYKSFLLGLSIIIFFIILSVYAVVELPYEQTKNRWIDTKAWEDYPKLAKPAWTKYFSKEKELEGTIIIDTRKSPDKKVEVPITIFGEVKGKYISVEVFLDFNYDKFPSQAVQWLFINSSSPVFVDIKWIKPDGTVLNVTKAIFNQGEYMTDLSTERHGFILDFIALLQERTGVTPNISMNGLLVLFSEPQTLISTQTPKVQKGTYKVVINAESRDPSFNLDYKLNIYGTMYGFFGTDSYRRDLTIAIIWGAPLALSFGLLASLLVTLLQMLIAAISAWYGGFMDHFIQRTNEVFMVLPFLPILVMISLFYKFTLWTLLLIVVALGIWGSGLKTFRAMFLQIREMPYIESAKAYGSSDMRIVYLYMIPRVLPIIIPNIVLSIPSFVFLEAALALLGLSDPNTITWGKVLEEAYSGGALYRGYYHWILAPSSMLIIISIAFALIGFTLDRVFNPRLKEM